MPAWTGIIDPSRAIDWSSVGVVGGIPTNATECGNSANYTQGGINPYGGSASPINTAISECAGATASTPKYILLKTGTFTLSNSITINKNYVGIRGTGPDSTIVKIADATCGIFGGAVCVGGAGGSNFLGNPDCTNNAAPCTHSWATAWTGTSTGGIGTYTKGDTRLIVGSTANMAVGRLIELDQLDETSDDGGVTNSIWQPVFSASGLPNYGRNMASEQVGGVTRYRTQHQVVMVTNVVDGTHVDVTPGIYMPTWRSSLSPNVASWGTSDSHYSFGNFIENITIENNGFSGFGDSIIAVEYCYNCYIKNVRTILGARNHVTFIQSAHSEIRDSYLWGNLTTGAESYGIECAGSSDILFINNIYHKLNAAELSPCVGSVSAYNYAFGSFHLGGNCVDQGGNISSCNWAAHWGTHDSGGGMRLYEGNQNQGLLCDNSHGNSPLYTAFRNAFTGQDDQGSKNAFRRAVLISAMGRGYNVVGNVLGTNGLAFSYEEPGDDGNDDLYIYNLGYSSGVSGGHDNVVKASLLRWGNYDTATDTVRWESSEVPTTGIPRINGNPVPSNQNLPNSFFLPGRPAFFDTTWIAVNWPPIGPDVTSGEIQGVANHVNSIPAKLCFEHLLNDPAYPTSAPRIKLYNSSLCYSAGGGSTTPITIPVSDSIDEIIFN